MSEINDTKVTFRGFDGEPTHAHLSDYLLNLLGATLDSFLPTEPYHLDLKIHSENLHNNHNNHVFECEAIVRIEGEKGPIVVRKTAHNFYAAAVAAESTLRKILVTRSRVREKVRRRPPVIPVPTF